MAYKKKMSMHKSGNFCIDNVPGKKAVLHKAGKKRSKPGIGKPHRGK